MRRMTRLLCLMLLFSLITFSCPLAEETDAPTGTPAPTPMLTAVPESALAPFNVVLPEDAHVEMAEGRITLVRGDSARGGDGNFPRAGADRRRRCPS